MTNENLTHQNQLKSLGDLKFNDKVTASSSAVSVRSFAALERTLHDLLCAAEGLQQLGHLATGDTEDPVKIGFLVESMGRHIHILRNEAAKELVPICEAFGLKSISY